MTVIKLSNKVFDPVVPVVVAGGGAAGLTAALAVRDRGVDVIVLERDHVPSGSTAMSQGNIAAAGTTSQIESGIDDSGDIFAEDIIRLTRGATDHKLAYKFAKESGPTIEWLVNKHQIPLALDLDWGAKLGHSRPRIHSTPSKTGTELMSCLQRACNEAGVDILTDSHVVDVYADDTGRVKGVRFVRPDGASEEIGCEALVVATCGFGANREMVQQFIPDMANVLYHGHEGNDGAGIKWGIELGAATADMTAFQGLGALADPSRILIHYNIILNGGFIINADGQRFTDETTDISGMGRKVMQQPNHHVWFVFDQMRQDFATKYEEHQQAVSVGAVRKANSLQELALITKIAPEVLGKTISDVVAMQQGNGRDPFGRDFATEEPLDGPPWYTVRSVGALFHTQGGLVINEDAQVKRTNGTLLPNLFAAGGSARSTSGPSDWGYIPAAGLFTATTQGRLAGDAAAKLTLTPQSTEDMGS